MLDAIHSRTREHYDKFGPPKRGTIILAAMGLLIDCLLIAAGVLSWPGIVALALLGGRCLIFTLVIFHDSFITICACFPSALIMGSLRPRS